MINAGSDVFESKRLRAIALLAALFVLASVFSYWIVFGNPLYLIVAGIGCVGTVVALVVLRDWRSGLFIFLIWIMFEDLIRKYAGNSLSIFFAKDIVVGLTYVSMLIAQRRGKLLTFKPPFLFWFGIFFWLGAAQVFNPNSPSILYGLLGIKTYFFYAPLLFAGYAILRTEKDLRTILMLNMWIALFVSGLGVIQSLGATNFLNPSDQAPELYILSHDTRMAPQSGLTSIRPTSVFVSDGRFASFLIPLFILAFGTAGYLMLRTKRGRLVVFAALGVVALATVLTGSRGAFVYLIVDTVVLSVGFLWGAPWRKKQAFRMGKAIRTAVIVAAVGFMLAIVFFPDAVKSRWAVYTETLSPTSSTSELGLRTWEYPKAELESVFSHPNWQLGNGIGVVSLGAQYVYRLTGVPMLQIGAESGYATLIMELGILGPIFWTSWTVSLIIAAWKVVRKLKQTPFFPIAFAIFWYAFMLLGPFTFYGLNGYQNYLTCAYLWLTAGMLFRLPGLFAESQAQNDAFHASLAG